MLLGGDEGRGAQLFDRAAVGATERRLAGDVRSSYRHRPRLLPELVADLLDHRGVGAPRAAENHDCRVGERDDRAEHAGDGAGEGGPGGPAP